MSLRSKVKATASAKANWRRPSGETKNDRSEGKPEWCGLRLGCSQALPRTARHAPPCPTSRPALCRRTVQKGSLHRHRRGGPATGLSSPPRAATRRTPTVARSIPCLLPACRRGAAREPDAGWISGLPAHQNAITHSRLLSVPRKLLTGARSKNDVSSRSATQVEGKHKDGDVSEAEGAAAPVVLRGQGPDQQSIPGNGLRAGQTLI